MSRIYMHSGYNHHSMSLVEILPPTGYPPVRQDGDIMASVRAPEGIAYLPKAGICHWVHRLHQNPQFLTALGAHRTRQLYFGDSYNLSSEFRPYPFQHLDPSTITPHHMKYASAMTEEQLAEINDLYEKEHALYDIAKIHWLFQGTDAVGYDRLTIGHKVSDIWCNDPTKAYRGMFLNLRGAYEGINIIHLEPRDSRLLYEMDTSPHKLRFLSMVTRDLANEGWIQRDPLKPDRWLVVADENLKTLHVHPIAKYH